MPQDRIWKPTKRQSDFLSLPDSIFEAMYGGAAGGGKTDTLMMLPLVRQFHNYPRFKMLFLRRTFPELDSEVIPRSKEFYNAAGFNPYQDQKKRWTHPSGAIIQFGHCEHEKDVAKYDTSEYNTIAFDELTSFTEYQYMYLTMSRCRSSDPNLPAIVRSGTNPGNIGHGFVRKRFVEPARDGYTLLRERRTFHGQVTELKRIFIPSKAQDNDYLMAADPNYINRLNALPEAERAAKLYGDWWTFSGQVFEDFRERPFPDEPDNAVHVVPPFQIPSYWPIVLAIDWGYRAVCCVGWYAINPVPSEKYPAKVYKIREYVCQKTKIAVWATDIRRIGGDPASYADVVLDPSAWQDRGQESLICDEFTSFFGRAPRKATNNRVGGVQLLHEYFRWKPRPPRYVPQEGFDPDLALKILRIKGPEARDEYIKLFQPEEPEGFLPKFQIFNTCTETIKAIPLCVADKDHPEDVAEFDGDDPYDETRYGIQACLHYLDGGRSEYEQTVAVAKQEEQLQRTGNVTQFYINMANLEAREHRASRGVRRFARRNRMIA